MPEYRLQTLLELRTRAEDAAKEALAVAAQALAVEQREFHRLEEELQRRRRAREEHAEAQLAAMLASGGLAIGDVAAADRFTQRLAAEETEAADAVERQREQVHAAEQELESCRRALNAASIARQAISRHQEGWARDRKKALDAREEQEQDEISQTQHARSRSK